MRALYERLGSTARGDRLDPGPLPDEGIRWLSLEGGAEPPPPLSGGRVYYYLHSVLASGARHVTLVEELTGRASRARVGKRRALEAHLPLYALHNDLRHCWYASAPYVSFWSYDVEQVLRGHEPSPLPVEHGRGFRPASPAAFQALTGVPYEEPAVSSMWSEVLRPLGASAMQARRMAQRERAFRQACGRYAAALCDLQRLAETTYSDAIRVLQRLEVAGNDLAARSRRFMCAEYYDLAWPPG
jgi:hypothetical protein